MITGLFVRRQVPRSYGGRTHSPWRTWRRYLQFEGRDRCGLVKPSEGLLDIALEVGMATRKEQAWALPRRETRQVALDVDRAMPCAGPRVDRMDAAGRTAVVDPHVHLTGMLGLESHIAPEARE